LEQKHFPPKTTFMQGYGIVSTASNSKWHLTSAARSLPDPVRVEMQSSFVDVHYAWFLSGVLEPNLCFKCTIEEPWASGKTISYLDLLYQCSPLLPFFAPDPDVYATESLLRLPFPNRCRGTLYLLKPIAHPSTFFQIAQSQYRTKVVIYPIPDELDEQQFT
jgi:hypothetical protein